MLNKKPSTHVYFVLLIVQTTGHIKKDPACGVSKGCYDNCTTPDDCRFLVTWTPQKADIMFEFQYKTDGQDDRWAAIGFSHDQNMVGIILFRVWFAICDRSIKLNI